MPRLLRLLVSSVLLSSSLALAARGESPAAFGRRCIPPGCVVPPSNIPDILGRHALPAGRIAGLGATPDFHHGLLKMPRRSWRADAGRRLERSASRAHTRSVSE